MNPGVDPTLSSLEVWPMANDAVIPIPDLDLDQKHAIRAFEKQSIPDGIVHGMLGNLGIGQQTIFPGT